MLNTKLPENIKVILWTAFLKTLKTFLQLTPTMGSSVTVHSTHTPHCIEYLQL
jgi:hypothetical protein